MSRSVAIWAMWSPPSGSVTVELRLKVAYQWGMQVHRGRVGIKFKNAPGGTTQAQIQTGLKVTATASGSGTFDLNAIIAEAKASLNISISVEASISSNWQYSHVTTANKDGWLQFGNWGYHVVWTKWRRLHSPDQGSR